MSQDRTLWKKTGLAPRVPVRCLGLIAVLAASLLVGGVGLVDAKTVIRVWNHHVHDKKYTTNMYKQFNKENKDVEIRYTSQIGPTYEEILKMALTAGEPPDLFYPIGFSLPDLIKRGAIISLNEAAPNEATLKAWMKRFPAGSFVEGLNVFNGEVYTFPLAGTQSAITLYYSRRLFRQAGLNPDSPPRTWEDFRAYARKLTKPRSTYGVSASSKNWEVPLENGLAIASGWPPRGFDYRTGRWTWTHPGLTGAVRLLVEMKQDGSYFPGLETMDEETARRNFALERAAMTFDGWWAVSSVLAYNPEADIDLALPISQDGKLHMTIATGPFAGDIRYVISSRTKSPAAAWKVIEFITSPEFQDGYVKGGYGVSIFPESNRPENFSIPQMAKVAEFGRTQHRVRPVLPEAFERVWQLLQPVHPSNYELYTGIWLGKESIDSLARFEKRFNDAIDEAMRLARAEGLSISRKDITFPDWNPLEDYLPKSKGK